MLYYQRNNNLIKLEKSLKIFKNNLFLKINLIKIKRKKIIKY